MSPRMAIATTIRLPPAPTVLNRASEDEDNEARRQRGEDRADQKGGNRWSRRPCLLLDFTRAADLGSCRAVLG